MSKWKKLTILCLAFALLLPTLALPTLAKERTELATPPTVSAQSAILVEADSGAAVYEKRCDTPMPMASTTKIMTALVALKLCAPETPITVDPSAVGVEGSSIYLTAGESLTLEQLLYALLLESANDAAVAIAVGVSGSVEAFAEEMNRQATALGLTDTHFTNPHGLDDENHYTTARELATVTREALREPLFRTIVSTRKTTIPHASPENVRLLINHNKLLRLYDGCIGVKTGFTKRSGRCLVSAAERDGVTLIAVTIQAPDDWNDHAALFDYGFSKFTSVLLCDEAGHLYPLTVVNGRDAYVMVCNDVPLRVTLPIGHGQILCTVELPRFAYAPVTKNAPVGKAVFRCDTDGDGKAEIIGEAVLTACYTVEKRETKRSFWQWLRDLFARFL
ncbi:MAG: D-alanyl-D-alanine carboxypeptidase [Clostridia bacterium]|nr:D-alanyl-D-alanine carboxypeptidase [Clostridia bacterium]